jgi:uncharacterized membrane protein (UPF0127 family)
MDVTDVKQRRSLRTEKMSENKKSLKMICEGNVIASKIIYCDGFFRKGTGLMFHSKDAVNDTAWLFRFNGPRKICVTMLFVFFPIDVVFLDDKNVVIEVKKNLTPFSNYTSRSKVRSFVELDNGMIRKYHLEKGQTIFFRR